MTPTEIISENALRRARHAEVYDPVLGLGSPISRRPLQITDTLEWMLPLSMFDEPFVASAAEAGSVEELWQQKRAEWGCDLCSCLEALAAARRQQDFEFWSATVAKIKDRESGKLVNFFLNATQRRLLAELEEQRMAGEGIREMILKHRRIGFTTFCYTYIAWHQIELYTGRDAWFVGLDLAGAGDVRERYDVIRRAYNGEMPGSFRVGQLTMRNWGSTSSTKLMIERDALVSIGTVERPNAPSGRPAFYVHLFEMGKWPSNAVTSAERVLQNMESMQVEGPGTIRIIESTAQQGTGTLFAEMCRDALADDAKRRAGGVVEADGRFFFCSFQDDLTCMDAFDSERDELAFVGSLTKDEREMFELDFRLEGIKWYRRQLRKRLYRLEPWRLKEEYPRWAEEALQSGGRRRFPQAYVQTMRKTCKQPMKRGYLVADAEAGPEAFKNIRFEADDQGPLSIWRKPGDDYGGLLVPPPVKHHPAQKRPERPDGYRLNARYCAAADIGGMWKGADYSDCVILDRAPWMFGAMPEVVAEWHGHREHDLFAWDAARLAYWYDRALLAVEVNTLQGENETKYSEGMTVLDEIIGYYPNLYQRTVRDTVTMEETQKVGFFMGKGEKPMVLTSLARGVREFHEHVTEGKETALGYVERSLLACAEMDIFMIHDDGSMGATDRSTRSHPKRKDDRVIARAIAKWLSDFMGMPTWPVVEAARESTPSMAGFS